MRRRRDHHAEDQKRRRPDDARPAAEPVNRPPEEEHAKDLADEVRVGDARLDGGGEAVRVEDLEDGVQVADDLGVVPVREEGQAADEDGHDGRGPADALELLLDAETAASSRTLVSLLYAIEKGDSSKGFLRCILRSKRNKGTANR
jgi:hypothetical protein